MAVGRRRSAAHCDAPSFAHQGIAGNLTFSLNVALSRTRPELFAYSEVGVRIAGRRAFQPEPDVAVLARRAPDGPWTENFLLVAEVLSPSNNRERIDRKVELYVMGSDALQCS